MIRAQTDTGLATPRVQWVRLELPHSGQQVVHRHVERECKRVLEETGEEMCEGKERLETSYSEKLGRTP